MPCTAGPELERGAAALHCGWKVLLALVPALRLHLHLHLRLRLRLHLHLHLHLRLHLISSRAVHLEQKSHKSETSQ